MPDMLEKPSKEYRLPTIDLTKSLHEDLEEFRASNENKPNKSDVVRTALREFLDRRKRMKKNISPLPQQGG